MNKTKKILVTGGAGFIGSHIVDALINKGHQVIVVDNLSTGKQENINQKALFYQIDVQSSELEEIFQKENPDLVDHHAAQMNVRKSVEDPLFDAKANILGIINLLENCRKHDVKKVVFASSGGALYGEADVIPTKENYPANPLSPYGIAKLASEKYLYYYQKVFHLPYVALRYANVYGPRQDSRGEAGVIAIFSEKILKEEQPVINGDGLQTRDYVYIEDVVKANLVSLFGNFQGSFNIGTAKETTVNELFQKINKLAGRNIPELHGPAKLGEQRRSCLDYALAEETFGWQPGIDLEEGMRRTLEYFRKNLSS